MYLYRTFGRPLQIQPNGRVREAAERSEKWPKKTFWATFPEILIHFQFSTPALSISCQLTAIQPPSRPLASSWKPSPVLCRFRIWEIQNFGTAWWCSGSDVSLVNGRVRVGPEKKSAQKIALIAWNKSVEEKELTVLRKSLSDLNYRVDVVYELSQLDQQLCEYEKNGESPQI